MELELRAFGSLEVRSDGTALRLASRLRQVLLAVLLMHRGQAVSTGALITSMWPSQPPAAAGENLRIHVHRLRRALGDGAAIQRRRPGYALVVPPEQVDVHQFEELCRQGHAALTSGDEAAAAELLDQALEWCRGPAFHGLEDVPALATEAERLRELQLTALEERAAAKLALGRHTALVAELRALVTEHPLRERFRALLMAALYHSRRRPDALDVYREGRQILVRDLGIEPGPECRELQRAILADNPALVPPYPQPGPGHTAAWSEPVPRQLPPDVPSFIGRATELQELERQRPEPADNPTLAVVSIEGTAGIGKTALAVTVAHRLADQFPDGQIFIDLHGFTPSRSPVEPADALGRLLHTLGVPGERIPAELDDRAALWRTRLAGRRMLILLDNARAEAQVAPLLPGASECLVLVTSRRRLAGLAATRTVPLDVLSQPEAVALFDLTSGRDGPDLPRELVTEAVEHCGRLPLAIRIAAARLRSHPAWEVSDLLVRLADQGRRLAELADEAGTRSVATAIEMSYRCLTAEQQGLYRGLSLHPGPDIDPYAAAALVDADVAQAHRLLDQLLDIHLLQEPVPGRFTFHALVRAHAITVAPGGRSETAAGTRLRDYYRRTAASAMDAAHPYERDHRPPVPSICTPAPEFADPVTATTWLDTELSNLLATAFHAAEHGPTELVWQLAAILHRHLRTRGHCRDAELLHQAALTTSRAAGRPAGELVALLGLGWVGTVRGWYQSALESLAEALETAHATGDRGGELRAQLGIGLVNRIQGRLEPALDSLTQALEIARATDDYSGTGEALQGLGEVNLLQSRCPSAEDRLTQALEIARATGNRAGEVVALLVLAEAHRLQGRHEPARTSYARALAVAQALGSSHGESSALRGLGHVYRAQQQYEPARQALRRALGIARDTGYRHGEASILIALGHLQRLEARYAEASEHYRQTLQMAEEIDDRNWQLEARNGLGRLCCATGKPDQAVAHHRAALELVAALDQPADAVRTHDGLAHAYQALDEPEQARQQWRQALEILEWLGTDHTEDEGVTAPAIQAHLASLDQHGGPSPTNDRRH